MNTIISHPSAQLKNCIERGGFVYFNAIPISCGSLTGGLLINFECLLSRRPRPHGLESRLLEILKQLRREKLRQRFN